MAQTRIEMLREIVAMHQAKRIRIDGCKVYVDALTANAIVTVYDALPPDGQAQLMALPLVKAAAIAWKCVKPAAH
jgi:hypothetical protein